MNNWLIITMIDNKHTKKRKRKYFKPIDAGSLPKIENKVFLVRFQDTATGKISAMDPFEKKEKAIETLKSYLKSGVCSWLVTYNE
jgi:hypothetical protein